MDDKLRKIVNENIKMHKSLINGYNMIDIEPSAIGATDIQVMDFLACLNPECAFYGLAYGTFVYKDSEAYQFYFNIHTPRAKGPHKSNTMTDVKRLSLHTDNGILYAERNDTDFGAKAFWTKTPISCLEGPDKSLRELMQSIADYSRRMQFCQILSKLDKKHVKWRNRPCDVRRIGS